MLDVESLDFAYRRRQIFKGLDWRVDEGARVVLLGPNGAGKTTLLRICAGALTPASARIRIDDAVADRRTLASKVALMPQHVTPVPRLSCRDQVAYAGWLGGLSKADAARRSGEALAQAGLSDKSDDAATRLSGGQLRRLGLAEAVVRNTRVLLLDEPTAGLDPAQRARLRGVLAGLPADRTVVVSTHETHDIADVFDRVCILSEGRFVFDGSPGQLLAETGKDTIEAAYTSLLEEE